MRRSASSGGMPAEFVRSEGVKLILTRVFVSSARDPSLRELLASRNRSVAGSRSGRMTGDNQCGNRFGRACDLMIPTKLPIRPSAGSSARRGKCLKPALPNQKKTVHTSSEESRVADMLGDAGPPQ